MDRPPDLEFDDVEDPSASAIRHRSGGGVGHHAGGGARQGSRAKVVKGLTEREWAELTYLERGQLAMSKAMVVTQGLAALVVLIIGVWILVDLSRIDQLITDMNSAGYWVRTSGVLDSTGTAIANAAMISGNITALMPHTPGMMQNADLTLAKIQQIPFGKLSDNTLELMKMAGDANMTNVVAHVLELAAVGERVLTNVDQMSGAMSDGGTLLVGVQMPSTKGPGNSAALLSDIRAIPIQTSVTPPAASGDGGGGGGSSSITASGTATATAKSALPPGIHTPDKETASVSSASAPQEPTAAAATRRLLATRRTNKPTRG